MVVVCLVRGCSCLFWVALDWYGLFFVVRRRSVLFGVVPDCPVLFSVVICCVSVCCVRMYVVQCCPLSFWVFVGCYVLACVYRVCRCQPWLRPDVCSCLLLVVLMVGVG